jgi:transcriptional regulator with XRE-family HTH domain
MARVGPTATTEEILAELGARIRRYRLQQNRTLDNVATEAGVAPITAQRAEAGHNPTMATVVRLLRALGRLDALENFLPTPLVSPLEVAKRRGREPRRARTPRSRRVERDDDA